MDKNIYADLAPFYDALNGDIDREKWAEYIINQCIKYGRTEIKELLDLGCGTGTMTLLFAAHGYDMVGLDSSPDMLSEAQRKAFETDNTDILWTCQSMTDFELYGTVDATISCLDCLNHLENTEELRRCFALVHNYLVPNGLFIFDMNTPYKFKEIYGDNAYILEDKNVLCAWQNEYDETTQKCTFFISLFEKTKGNQYARFDSEQVESCFSLSELKEIWESEGFVLEALHGDIDETPISDTTERWHFVLRAIKR